MKISKELEGVRINVSRTAELAGMTVGHFRRLIRTGVFPSPKRTTKQMPYFDYPLLCAIAEILKTGIGASGEEISFHRRRLPQEKQRENRSVVDKAGNGLVAAILDGCQQLGISIDGISPKRIEEILRQEFKEGTPELRAALPVVARRLIEGIE